MKKPLKIALGVLVAGALAASTAFAIANGVKLKDYENSYEMNYRRAMSTLVDAVNSIDTTLAKGVYATSPSLLVSLSGDIWRQSEVAKNALAELPSSDIALDRTSVFLSQVGDFSLSLARRAAGGQAITAEERKALEKMNETSAQVAAELDTLNALSEGSGFFNVDADRALRHAEERAAEPASYAGGMADIETNLPESPVLIYDGPYSDHITLKQPAYLESSAKLYTAEEARVKAAEYLETGEENIVFAAESSAEPKTYSFTIGPGCITLSADGGHVLYFGSGAVPGEQKLSFEQATERAAAFLAAKGYEKMEQSYYYSTGGICYINYEYKEGDVTIYPDLIQVGIALDTGKLAYVQTLGFMNNHRERGDLTPALTSEMARSRLSPGLTLEGDGRLCVIPSPGENELLCYEFKCTGANGRTYLVYVNAASGVEENIFMLISDDAGTLTV